MCMNSAVGFHPETTTPAGWDAVSGYAGRPVDGTNWNTPSTAPSSIASSLSNLPPGSTTTFTHKAAPPPEPTIGTAMAGSPTTAQLAASLPGQGY